MSLSLDLTAAPSYIQILANASLVLAVVISLIVLLATACSSAATPQTETITLKIAVLPIIDTLPLYVAQQNGFFAKHGVEIELVPVASAPERVQLKSPVK